MLKIFISLMLMINVSFALSVEEAGFNNLSSGQQAKILAQIAQENNTNAVEASSVTPENAQKWIGVGASIGKGLAATAKELGVAINDFSKTDIGKIATFLIVWSVIGNALTHIFGSIVFLLFALTFIILLYFKTYPKQYKDIVKDSKESKMVTISYRDPLSSDAVGFATVYVVVTVVLFCIILFSGGN